MKQAMYYEKREGGSVQCFLCPHNCVIKQDGAGICRVRKNIGGELYSLNYGKVTSIALDPVEKKPLYRFHPGKYILSAGTFGCNLKCSFCQNWTISQGMSPDDERAVDITPGQLVKEALKHVRHGNIGIAYTYNEPSIWYEFVYETSMLAKKEGLANVLVTNGFISRKPLEELLPFVDAMNIDVKSFNPSFYKEICKGSLENVKETVEMAAAKCHVEVTTLVIPGFNDSVEEMDEIARWLASVSPEIVLHLSRYFPRYKMNDRSPTPVRTLENLRDEALKYLRHVYLGNVW